MHQNRSHHHHGTAEGSFTAKKWFGHRAGRSPCAHSIGKFFLCYIILLSSETCPRLARELLVYIYICYISFANHVKSSITCHSMKSDKALVVSLRDNFSWFEKRAAGAAACCPYKHLFRVVHVGLGIEARQLPCGQVVQVPIGWNGASPEPLTLVGGKKHQTTT